MKIHIFAQNFSSDIEIVKLMFENKADLNIQNEEYFTPLYYFEQGLLRSEVYQIFGDDIN